MSDKVKFIRVRGRIVPIHEQQARAKAELRAIGTGIVAGGAGAVAQVAAAVRKPKMAFAAAAVGAGISVKGYMNSYRDAKALSKTSGKSTALEFTNLFFGQYAGNIIGAFATGMAGNKIAKGLIRGDTAAYNALKPHSAKFKEWRKFKTAKFVASTPVIPPRKLLK